MHSHMLFAATITAVVIAQCNSLVKDAERSLQAGAFKLPEAHVQEPDIDSTPFDDDAVTMNLKRDVAPVPLPIVPNERAQKDMAMPTIVHGEVSSPTHFGELKAVTTTTLGIPQSLSTTLVPGEASYLESQATVQSMSAERWLSMITSVESAYSVVAASRDSAFMLSESSYKSVNSEMAASLQSLASVASMSANILVSSAHGDPLPTTTASAMASATAEPNAAPTYTPSWMLTGLLITAVGLLGLAIGL